MEYSEKKFAISANRKALVAWTVVGIVLSAAYAIEIVKHLRTIGYYATFLGFCWVPYILGLIALKVRGMHTRMYKEILGIGYSAFFLLCHDDNQYRTCSYVCSADCGYADFIQEP